MEQIDFQNAQFPFGQYLHEVKQTDRRAKKVFVLGVYASAVHAEWHAPDGKILCKALAVASEPYIFWNGNREEAEKIISEIAIPKDAGYLRPADDQFNGPSGRSLDEKILAPLGFTRDDAWLCDLVPYACQNENQKKAVDSTYTPLQLRLGLPKYSISQLPKNLTDENRRNEITRELAESQADTIILLGDDPVQWFLSFVSDCKNKRLVEFSGYGAKINVTISGKKYAVIPLAHPRQISALGTSSPKWFNLHQQWIREIDKTKKNT